MTALLEINNLTIGFGSQSHTVEGVNFSVRAGETVALVGESGSGKTLTCRSILRILPKTAQIRAGQIVMQSGDQQVDLLSISERAMRNIRGDRIAMIFQEPMRSLSPLHTIGNQISEVLKLHRDCSDTEAKEQTLEEFNHVGFVDPDRAYSAYPFELSGGMQQRAMIAMATVAKPDLIIADEPTTALDMTTQAQVLGLLKSLQAETGMALILVTHDLGVVANMADQVVVMNKGRIMESGSAKLVLGSPAHGYTKKLFAAAPILPVSPEITPSAPGQDLILDLQNVSKTYYSVRRGSPWAPHEPIRAVCGIDLQLPRGDTLAIVGESGSGKSTCARVALGAEKPDAGGKIYFTDTSGGEPVDINTMSAEDRFDFQSKAQMVFQDPHSSLSPRMKILEALTEPLDIHNVGTVSERRDKACELLYQVGLDPSMLRRYPHAFSGGQRQRLSIARALALDPQLVVCDEPTSSLDVSVQSQILDLLEEIRETRKLSYLFISHDLAVVARIASSVAVMRRGRVVEQAPPDVLLNNPQHPYTQALIAAHPEPDIHRPIDLEVVAKGAGAPESWPEAFRISGSNIPPLTEHEPEHLVRAFS